MKKILHKKKGKMYLENKKNNSLFRWHKTKSYFVKIKNRVLYFFALLS